MRTFTVACKGDAQRKRDERQRMRGKGFVLKHSWVHPDDWPTVSRYINSLKSMRISLLDGNNDGA